METQARYVLVGIVTLVMVLGLGVVLFWMSGSKQQEHTKQYAIYFKDQGLSGVARGSVVTMRGIKVGTVESIRLLQLPKEGARVVVTVSDSTPVARKTEAIVKTNLLTGLSGIELNSSAKVLAPVETNPNENLPTIPEGPNEFAQLGGTLEDVFMRLSGSLDKLDKGLSEENIEALGNTLRNLDAITASLAKDNGLKKMIEGFAKFVEEARSTNEQVQNLSGNLTAASRSVSLSVEDMSRSMDRLEGSVSRAAEGFEDPQAILMGKNPALRGPGEEKR